MRAGERGVHPTTKSNSKALVVSLLVHLAALPCFWFWAIPVRRPAVKEEVVDVEIVRLPAVTGEQAHNRQPTTVPPDVMQADPMNRPSHPVESEPVDGAPARVRPQHMLSESVLADDRSRRTRKALSELAPAEQVEQLCNLEAMAQVGAWSRRLRPDRVIAYALASTQFDRTSFSAEGAALHSGDDWYRLQFKCNLTSDGQKVAAFEFLLGDVIPKRDWQDFGLPDESGSAD